MESPQQNMLKQGEIIFFPSDKKFESPYFKQLVGKYKIKIIKSN